MAGPTRWLCPRLPRAVSRGAVRGCAPRCGESISGHYQGIGVLPFGFIVNLPCSGVLEGPCFFGVRYSEEFFLLVRIRVTRSSSQGPRWMSGLPSSLGGVGAPTHSLRFFLLCRTTRNSGSSLLFHPRRPRGSRSRLLFCVPERTAQLLLLNGRTSVSIRTVPSEGPPMPLRGTWHGLGLVGCSPQRLSLTLGFLYLCCEVPCSRVRILDRISENELRSPGEDDLPLRGIQDVL